MMTDFEMAFQFIILHEGGYVNDPDDPGGETNFGISKNSFPKEDIANMTEERAKELYKLNYWDAIGADRMKLGRAIMAFDCAVNQGLTRAVTIMKSIPKEAGDIDWLMIFSHSRHIAYTKSGNWDKYGKGWSDRLLKTTLSAAFACMESK